MKEFKNQKTPKVEMPQKYEAVKVLRNAGVSVSEIANTLSLGRSTIFQMLRTENYEAYREKKTQERLDHQAREEAKRILALQAEDVKIEPLPKKWLENVETATEKVAEASEKALEQAYSLKDIDALTQTLSTTNTLLGDLIVELRNRPKKWF